MSASPAIRLPSGVTCFICTVVQGSPAKHPTVDEVAECHRRSYEWEADIAAELASEASLLKHLESLGWEEAEIQRQCEDAAGVVQFEDAVAAVHAALEEVGS